MRHVNRSGNLGEARRAAMAVLAAVPAVQLHRCWKEAAIVAEAETLRGPETGLVAVRGRIGGGGAPFNVGEATVTRATVRLATGEVGHAYLLGRDAERARLAATVDALLQCADKLTVEVGIVFDNEEPRRPLLRFWSDIRSILRRERGRMPHRRSRRRPCSEVS